jgi:hypothetical protein
MGSWLRSLSGYRRYQQHEVSLAELKREFPELTSSLSRSKIPDPWEDFPRKDAYDRSWKRHRKEQYRAKTERRRARPEKVKVTYDTPYVVMRNRYVWLPYTRQYGEAHFTRRRRGHPWGRYRVRESYRRHRVDK